MYTDFIGDDIVHVWYITAVSTDMWYRAPGLDSLKNTVHNATSDFSIRVGNNTVELDCKVEGPIGGDLVSKIACHFFMEVKVKVVLE